MIDKAADLFAHLDWDRDIRPNLSFAEIEQQHQLPQSIIWTGPLDRRNRRAPIAETACGLTFSPRTVLLALHEMALRPHVPFEETLTFCLNRSGNWLRTRPSSVYSNVMDPWLARFGTVPPAPSLYIDRKGVVRVISFLKPHEPSFVVTSRLDFDHPTEANVKRLRAYRVIAHKLHTIFASSRLDAQ
jgi:hypothetical protein